MAARTRRGVLTLPDDWREKIRLTLILQRLDACAAGEIEMTADQLAAAKMLLSKVIPDIKAVELSGPDGGPMNFETFLLNLQQPPQLEPPRAD